MTIKPTKEELSQIAEDRKQNAKRRQEDLLQKLEFQEREKASKDIAAILASFPADKIDGILENATKTHAGYVALQEVYRRRREDDEQRARWERDGMPDITS